MGKGREVKKESFSQALGLAFSKDEEIFEAFMDVFIALSSTLRVTRNTFILARQFFSPIRFSSHTIFLSLYLFS
jgi:hypothetical protein